MGLFVGCKFEKQIFVRFCENQRIIFFLFSQFICFLNVFQP